uniref:Uncharacterized protein n=1 Tax=Rhizophora mucronata TaxID=61149 RepID=A0A2P2QR39_RHIMU
MKHVVGLRIMYSCPLLHLLLRLRFGFPMVYRYAFC